MSKQKWKAWFFTTLTLFIIVRVSQSCINKQQDEKNTDSQLIEKVEVMEKPLPVVQKTVPQKVTITIKKPPSVEPPPQKKLPPPQKPLTDQKTQNFKKKSDKVYFKVVNGLALVGGDVLIGQVKEDENLEGHLFERELEKTRLWPSNSIPYGITDKVTPLLKKRIMEAVNYLNKNTDLDLVPLDQDYDRDAIVFDLKKEAPCSSYVGRIGGYQPIFLNEKSCQTQQILHEIKHALGFVHEQQREDRDDKLDILWDNIEEDMKHNFSILPDSFIHPYVGSVFDIDFTSVMMYPDDAFAKKGLKSMETKSSDKISPVKQGLSPRDIERINYLYGS